MGLPLLAGAFRVQLLWNGTTATRPWSTKFDYIQDEPIVGPTAALEVAELFNDTIGALWANPATIGGAFFAQTRLDTVRVYALEGELQGAEVDGDSRVVGTGAEAAPGEVAMVASLRTQFLGRQARGRQYWGGLAAGGTNTAVAPSGILNTNARNALQTLVTGLLTLSLSGNDLRLAVLSTADAPDPTADRPPAVGRLVQTVLVDANPDTQRRRGLR